MKSTVREKLIARTVVDENGCWIWRGAKSAKGYGQLAIQRVWSLMDKQANAA